VPYDGISSSASSGNRCSSWLNIGSSAGSGAGAAGARRTGVCRGAGFGLRAAFFFAARAGFFRRAADFLGFDFVFDRFAPLLLFRFFAMMICLQF
jgi:hypothetical protein